MIFNTNLLATENVFDYLSKCHYKKLKSTNCTLDIQDGKKTKAADHKMISFSLQPLA